MPGSEYAATILTRGGCWTSSCVYIFFKNPVVKFSIKLMKVKNLRLYCAPVCQELLHVWELRGPGHTQDFGGATVLDSVKLFWLRPLLHHLVVGRRAGAPCVRTNRQLVELSSASSTMTVP